MQVHDLGLDGDVYYVRMDFVDGADLASLIRPGLARGQRPPVELSLLIAEEIAVALDYVHRFCDDAGRPLGLVHRDISPSNILLSRSGEVKLADFGIAKATHLTEITRGNVRKRQVRLYVARAGRKSAPDRGQRSVRAGGDADGAVPGSPAYDAESVLETMERIRQAAPPDLSGLGGELPTIIRRCLARDPNDRFASTEELRREIARLRHFAARHLRRSRALGQPASAARPKERALREARGEAEPLHEAITQQLSEPRGGTQIEDSAPADAPTRARPHPSRNSGPGLVSDGDKIIVTLS